MSDQFSAIPEVTRTCHVHSHYMRFIGSRMIYACYVDCPCPFRDRVNTHFPRGLPCTFVARTADVPFIYVKANSRVFLVTIQNNYCDG
jgi:hypothetical protein